MVCSLLTQRLAYLLLILLAFALLINNQPLQAEPAASSVVPNSVVDAEIARLRLRLYEKQEYPLARRKLNDQITLTRAKLDSYARLEKEKLQFTKFQSNAPVFYDLEIIRLESLETKLKLNQLIDEKSLLERFHADRIKLLRLELQAAQYGRLNN